jgi:oligopeptide transport system substrate-binding protein
MVGLDELKFLPVSDGTTAVNLYRSGAVATMPGFNFPPLFMTAVGRKKDFHAEPCFGTVAATISAQKAPLDNLLLRYALNMATEKGRFTDLLRGGRIAASTVVPPVPGYLRPGNLEVIVDGRRHDVLAFNIEGARALLVKAGYDPEMGRGHRTLELTYHSPAVSDSKLRGEMLQQQWRRNLGIRVNLAVHEFSLHFKKVLEGDYSGVAEWAFLMTYFDPPPISRSLFDTGCWQSDWLDRSRLCIDARKRKSHIGLTRAYGQAGELRRASAPGNAGHTALLRDPDLSSKAVCQGPYQQPV